MVRPAAARIHRPRQDPRAADGPLGHPGHLLHPESVDALEAKLSEAKVDFTFHRYRPPRLRQRDRRRLRPPAGDAVRPVWSEMAWDRTLTFPGAYALLRLYQAASTPRRCRAPARGGQRGDLPVRHCSPPLARRIVPAQHRQPGICALPLNVRANSPAGRPSAGSRVDHNANSESVNSRCPTSAP